MATSKTNTKTDSNKKKTDAQKNKNTSKKSNQPSQTEIDNNLRKAEALKKIVEHNRDYLKVDLTIPLGDKALKQVHTNQWLFTDLPKEFDLVNWTIIAQALNANTNRFEGYVKNRWYIESVDISVDASGKAEMKLGCNAFASTFSEYSEAFRKFQSDYKSATEKKTTDTSDSKKTTSAAKNTTNATTNKKSVINEQWVKKYSVPSVVVNKIKEICKVENTDEQNVKAWFKWMDAHVNYAKYFGHQRSIQYCIKVGSGNCVDNSRVFRAGCLALGVKCNFVKNTCTSPNHQYNRVYLNGKKIDVDCGRDYASWGSNWGGHSSCGTETTVSW